MPSAFCYRVNYEKLNVAIAGFFKKSTFSIVLWFVTILGSFSVSRIKEVGMSNILHRRLLLGTAHRTPDTFFLEDITPQVALGTTPGNAISIAKKRDDNEDAAAWISYDQQGSLALLADAHFGAESGHIALDYVQTHFSPIAPDLLRQMFRLHLELDSEIRSHQHLQGRFRMTSATTFISAYFTADNVLFCTTGDSTILRFRAGKLETLTPIRQIFLGNPEPVVRSICLILEDHCAELTPYLKEQPYHALYQLACYLRNLPCPYPTLETGILTQLSQQQHSELRNLINQYLPHFGSFSLQTGDIIMLASDGVTPEASALETSDLEQLLTTVGPSAAQVAEVIMKATVGDDNLTLIVYRA